MHNKNGKDRAMIFDSFKGVYKYHKHKMIYTNTLTSTIHIDKLD